MSYDIKKPGAALTEHCHLSQIPLAKRHPALTPITRRVLGSYRPWFQGLGDSSGKTALMASTADAVDVASLSRVETHGR